MGLLELMVQITASASRQCFYTRSGRLTVVTPTVAPPFDFFAEAKTDRSMNRPSNLFCFVLMRKLLVSCCSCSDILFLCLLFTCSEDVSGAISPYYLCAITSDSCDYTRNLLNKFPSAMASIRSLLSGRGEKTKPPRSVFPLQRF